MFACDRAKVILGVPRFHHVALLVGDTPVAVLLEQTADPDTVLQEVVRRIVAAGDPQRIVLFGSRARYDNSEDSDIDLLVIEDSELPRYKRSPRYYHATCGTFPARDIVVWTPDEVREWESVPNHFVTTAVREGRVLYERPG